MTEYIHRKLMKIMFHTKLNQMFLMSTKFKNSVPFIQRIFSRFHSSDFAGNSKLSSIW